MRVVIAAAGTGGHINPGLAIANEIKEKEPDSKIIFIGTSRGLENNLVPRAGYELKQIEAYGISRKLNISNIKKLYKTYKSVSVAKKILEDFKPDVVIGTGGYICIPVGKAAHKLKIPIVLHESNAFPGVAVKMLSKDASKVLVGFEDAKERLPKAKKVVVTGTPSKIEKIDYNKEQKEEKLKELGLDAKQIPTILVFGGSQGAMSINNAVVEILKNKLNKNYQIVWAVGINNYDTIKENLKNSEIEKAVVVPYIYNMQEIMNACDLVVCRSGAMTITEISILEKPAIFIPFPFATENHQEYNAKVLKNVGAADIILDKYLTATTLNNAINNIISDNDKLVQMGKNAGKVSSKNVEEKIYREIKEII